MQLKDQAFRGRLINFEDLALPKHKRLQLSLEDKIINKEWKPGDRIPNETDIMEMYGLSYATVSRAVRALAKSGLVKRVRKRGTFVTDHQPPPSKGPTDRPVIHTLAHFHGGIPIGFHPHFAALLNGLVASAGEHQMAMKFTHAPNGKMGIDEHFMQKHGIIGFSASQPRMAELRMAKKLGIPCVVTNGAMGKKAGIPFISNDADYEYRRVFQQFKDIGAKCVAMVDIRKRHAYEKVAAEVFDCPESKIPVVEIKVDDWFYQGASKAVTQLLKLRRKVDAIFVGDDFLLLHMDRLLIEKGIKVPDDFAIIGRGSSQSKMILGQRYSMIEYDSYMTAKHIINLLVKQINGEEEIEKEVVVKPKLVIRDSCGN